MDDFDDIPSLGDDAGSGHAAGTTAVLVAASSPNMQNAADEFDLPTLDLPPAVLGTGRPSIPSASAAAARDTSGVDLGPIPVMPPQRLGPDDAVPPAHYELPDTRRVLPGAATGVAESGQAERSSVSERVSMLRSTQATVPELSAATTTAIYGSARLFSVVASVVIVGAVLYGGYRFVHYLTVERAYEQVTEFARWTTLDEHGLRAQLPRSTTECRRAPRTEALDLGLGAAASCRADVGSGFRVEIYDVPDSSEDTPENILEHIVLSAADPINCPDSVPAADLAPLRAAMECVMILGEDESFEFDAFVVPTEEGHTLIFAGASMDAPETARDFRRKFRETLSRR